MSTLVRRDGDLLVKLFFNIGCCSVRDLNFEQLQEWSVSGGTLNIALGGKLAS
jgi:hypothetical protein